MSSTITSGSTLKKLAEEAGLLPAWKDAFGETRHVKEDVLRAMLETMGLSCNNDMHIRESLTILHEEKVHASEHLIIARTNKRPVFRHVGSANYVLTLENGDKVTGAAIPAGPGLSSIDPVSVPGYHQLCIGDTQMPMALCPERCPAVDTLSGGSHPPAWGVAVQVYSLWRQTRSEQNPGLPSAWSRGGDYSLLKDLAVQAAGQGARAVAISPVHAMFSAAAHRYSPYSPSSRLFLNIAYIDPSAVLGAEAVRAAMQGQASEQFAVDDSVLLDWKRTVPARLSLLRRLYEHFSVHGSQPLKREFQAFRQQGGEALERHAVFEALHAQYTSTLGPESGWGDWPATLRHPSGSAVKQYAMQNAEQVGFHAFLQWLAAKGLGSAHSSARAAGMPVGLIADLAIGTDPRGSHAWSRQTEILANASVGAPPDIHQADGQNWGLTAFSPRALRNSGYCAFIETLRAVLAHAGGVRIDHILGLARMWIVAQSADAADGVYIRYPLDDMLDLVALEAWRHRTVVIGENLGTVPEGFNEVLEQKGVLGTSVLWFERGVDDKPQADAAFKSAGRWPNNSVATTTTHDLPTVNGWWKGRDLQWKERLGGFANDDDMRSARQTREHEKKALWQALRDAGCVTAAGPQLPEAPPRNAVLSFVACSPSPLVIIPIEDMLGIDEQPNFPGAIGAGHPNWRQTLPLETKRVFSDETVQQSIDAIVAGRAEA